MSLDRLKGLTSGLRAKYELEKARAQPVLDEEARLRSELRKLDQHEQLSRSQDQATDLLRPFGGDVLWASWLARQRRELNMELARTLAARAGHLHQMKQAYGRLLVAEQLEKSAVTQAGLEYRSKDENALLESLSSHVLRKRDASVPE